MKFGVIYSVDVPRGVSLRPYTPKNWHVWFKTEGNDQYDYAYLEGEWIGGRHGKYCALLTKEQFLSFVSEQGLSAESCETMGSLGCPVPEGGIDLGFLPAISFNGHDYEAITNAYVTPFPEVVGKAKPFSDRDFQRIKRVLLDL